MSDAFEKRMGATTFELREADDTVSLVGYASTFGQPYSMGWYTESVDPGAFGRTLGRNPDVRLLLNHDGLPLARTVSGTLHLSTDSTGLEARADLDPTDPDVAALVPKMRRRDLNQMSFAFRMFGRDGDTWNDDMSQRTLTSLDLDGGDVSVVTYPANPNAKVGLRQAGLAAESVQSALRTLEARNATDEEVAAVLARALGTLPLAEEERATTADLPLLKDRAHGWDSAAADARVRSWAGGSSSLSDMDWAKYGRAFMWHDAAAPDKVGSYKLPFADIVDGTLTAIWRGVTGVAAVLQGGRGGVDLPDSARDGVKTHVAAYYAKAATLFDDKSITPPWSDEAKAALVDSENRRRIIALAG